MVRQIRLIPVLALLASVALGCSGGGGGSTAPTTTPQGEFPVTPPNPVLSESSPGATESGAPLFVAAGSLNFETGAITLEPVATRDLQLTPVAEDRRVIDVSPFLNGTPCVDCFKVTALGMDDNGNVLADFTMRHPFSNTTLRKDLDVFDPIAIFVTSGSTSFPGLDRIDENGSGSTDDFPTGNLNFIGNPDGYTNRHDFLVQSLFPGQNYEGNINPFVSFYTENNPSPTGVGSPIQNHRFAMGPAQDSKRVVFNRPTGGGNVVQFNFLVVLSVSYGQSATFANGNPDPNALGSRLNPVYFNPEFNMKEAYGLTANGGPGIEAGNAAASTKVTVFVKDWQSTATVDAGYPNFPDYTNRAGLKWRSDLSEVKLSVPDVSATTYAATRDQRISGTGAATNPYRFEFDVTNDKLAAPGIYTGLIAAVDQYQADARVLLGFTAAERQTHFTNYQTVQVVVTEPACPTPTAVAEASPTTSPSGADITFSSDQSTAQAGSSIILYEWDFDGVPPVDWTSMNPDDVNYAYVNDTGADVIETATLTVRTDCGTSHSDSIDITVLANRPPVASFTAMPNPVNPGIDVNFDGSASSDPDPGDSIVSYEWDFDYTAPTFDVDGTGVTVANAYSNSGTTPLTKTVALRVTDTRSATHIKTETITVNPPAPCVAPIARAGSSTTSAVSGQPITFFANLSTTGGADPFTKYAWDWDIFDADPPEVFDAVGGTLPPVDHTYIHTAGGTRQFRARLTVYTSDTCFNSTSSAADCSADFRCDILVTIQSNTPPIAVCNATPDPVVSGCPVSFSEAGSSDPDPTGSIVKYQWDWDDSDGINWATPDYESTTQGGAMHAYTNDTDDDITVTATLRVVDNLGTTHTCSKTITVRPNQAPTAVAAADPPATQFSGQPVRLLDSASSDIDACVGTGLTYVWDFDDSNGVILDPANPGVDYTSTTPDGAVHVYLNPTTSAVNVTATLRVIDGSGAFNDDTVVILVGPIPPVPVITFLEAQRAINPGVVYNYKIMTDKSWDSIIAASGDTGLWDFTNTTMYPTGGNRTRIAGTPAEFPGVDLPGSNVIFSAPTYAGQNYEGRNNTANPIRLIGTSSNNGPGEDLELSPHVLINYPQNVNDPGFIQAIAFGELQGIQLEFDFDVRTLPTYGLVTTYAGVFNCLVEWATVTTDYEGLLTTTQREYIWVSDEGYIVVDWIEKLDGLTGASTGLGSGIVLTSYTVP